MILGIYGAGGLGRELLELARLINSRQGRWKSVVFIDDVQKGEVNGADVYTFADAAERFAGRIEITAGVGEPAVRERLFHTIRQMGVRVPSLIHPDVRIPDTTRVGEGVTVQYGCFISCNAVIEDLVYLQPHVNVGHNDVLKEGCVLSAAANLAGNVTVGRYSYIGMSAAVREGVSIGDYSIVGMCSGVYRDIPDGVIAMGNPARPMKKNEDRRVYK